MKKIFAVILPLFLLAAMAGCTPEPTESSPPPSTEPSTFATPESYSVDWEMTAYLIELDGSIAASFPLRVTDEMWSEGPNFYHDLALHVSEEVYDYFPYMINGGDAEDNPQRRDMYDKPGDFRVDGYILDRRDSTPAYAQLVLNTEKEYFLGWFGEEYGRLLVACTNPNEGPADVLAHFQEYLTLRRIEVQID